MSGHNKWSTIKHKKAAADAKKGQACSKIAREILVAAKHGGGDPQGNITLRALIQKARAVNMPADNIDRAIKKGTGELESEVLEEITYEGYAQGGVAVIVECVTDNRNRSTAEVKHAFTKHGGSLAGQGAVSRSFSRKGFIIVQQSEVEEDRLLEVALEAGAEDVRSEDGTFEVFTDTGSFGAVMDALAGASIPTEDAEITLIPETTVPVTDSSQASSLLRFINALDDLDDVQKVHANFDMDDDLMAKLQAED
jgi:YebC/PmpR family DNA-binding regulatory protein